MGQGFINEPHLRWDNFLAILLLHYFGPLRRQSPPQDHIHPPSPGNLDHKKGYPFSALNTTSGSTSLYCIFITSISFACFIFHIIYKLPFLHVFHDNSAIFGWLDLWVWGHLNSLMCLHYRRWFFLIPTVVGIDKHYNIGVMILIIIGLILFMFC